MSSQISMIYHDLSLPAKNYLNKEFLVGQYMGVSINGGTPIAGWVIMDNPTKMGWFGTSIFLLVLNGGNEGIIQNSSVSNDNPSTPQQPIHSLRETHQ